MTNPNPQPRQPCTCRPNSSGHHGIVLHADEVDDLVLLLTTVEDWLLHTDDAVHHDLLRFLHPARPDTVHQLIDNLGATASHISQAARDPQLAWTPC